MTRKFYLSLMCLAVLASMASMAQGAITPGNLVPNVINELEDDDFDMLVNAGGTIANPGANNVLDVGDYLATIVRITALRVPAGGPQIATATDVERTFTAVALQRIATKVALAGGVLDGVNDVQYTFAPPTAAEWTAVTAGLFTPSNNTTFAIVFDDPDNINQLTGNALTAFASVDGVKQWEFGFTGAAGEAWRAATDTDNILTSFSIASGSFSAALNVTGQFAGPQLAPFTRPPVGTVLAQLHLVNGSIISATAAFPPFPVKTDADFEILPVPEPASMVVWGGLLAGAGIWARSRRRVK
jgi:hypothetical protein